MIRTDLGAVTAYAAAKAKGYTGTETQFEEDMAALSDNASKLNTLYPADTTLALTGKAADAKAVGDQFALVKQDNRELDSRIVSLSDEENPAFTIDWEVGGIKTATGEEFDDSTKRRDSNYRKESDFTQIAANTAELYVIRYTFDGTNYTLYGAVQVTGANEPYVFSASSPYYFRLSCNTPNKISNVVLTSRSKLIADVKQIPSIVSDIEDIKDQIEIAKTSDLYHGATLVDKYISWSDGSEVSNVSARTSAFIPVQEGDVLDYTLTVIGQVTAAIACYDNTYAFIQDKSVKGGGTAGTWYTNTGTFTVPTGVAYIKFSTYSAALSTDSLVKTQFIPVNEAISESVHTQWQGKKWAGFGTSITDTSYIDTNFLQQTGKYPVYLAEMSGMVFSNYGIAGGSITTDVQNRVLSTTLSGFDIVTVEGSVNDHATSKPIGTVGDTSTDTFAGAIYQIAKYVYENSNATLFFITDYVGRYVHINPTPAGTDFYGDCAPTKTNNLNLLQIDYINMMIKQCEYFGIPCITAGQDAGINLLTGNLYLIDHIHSTWTGGRQYAQTIWNYLKNTEPRVLTA